MTLTEAQQIVEVLHLGEVSYEKEFQVGIIHSYRQRAILLSETECFCSPPLNTLRG
jgi:hypothetical protein